LAFPHPPTLMQVLEAVGVSPAVKTPHSFLANRTQVCIHERRGGETEIELKPMTPATTMGLGGRLNLNRLSLHDLTFLPGIGPVTAGRILAARQRQGGLKGVEDLMRIKGIGAETIKRFRAFIVFED